MTSELKFKKMVYSAKSEPELWDAIYEFWQELPVDGEIDINVFDGKPKYQKKINEILLNLYFTNYIHAIWLRNKTLIRKTW